MRVAAVACAIAALAFAAAVLAAEGKQAAGGCDECVAAPQGAQAGQAAQEEQPDDLARTLAEEALKARRERAERWHLTQRDLWLIGRSRAHMHAIRRRVDDLLQELAVVMYDPQATDEERQQKAERIAAEIRRLQEADRQLQLQLIQQTGADKDPVKYAALMLMGAIDSGRRVMCQVKVGVAGGANELPHIPIPGHMRRQLRRQWRGQQQQPAQ